MLTGAVNQDVWSLRNLGFKADPISTAAGALNDPALPDPLLGYDVIWNTAAWPGAANQATARARLTAFFANGGGYLGAGANGASFLNTGGPDDRPHRRDARRQRTQRDHPLDQRGRRLSPISGAYPAEDTAIVDPPAWFSAVPSSFSVDARLATTNFFLSGLWLFDAESADSSRLSARRPRHEHRRHVAARELRDEPALPGGSGARVADGRRRRLLGRSVGRTANEATNARGGKPAPRRVYPTGRSAGRKRTIPGPYSSSASAWARPSTSIKTSMEIVGSKPPVPEPRKTRPSS